MKSLVVFYSRTGNTKKVAETIAEQLDADMEKLIDMKKRAGIIGWLRSGWDAIREKTTDLRVTKYSPQEYELILLGTPVWANKITPALRTYILEKKDAFKRVAFFCTEGSSDADDVFSSLENLCEKQPISTKEILAKEVKKGLYKDKVGKFVQDIQNNTQ